MPRVTVKPSDELADLVAQFPASTVESLTRASALALAADQATMFLVGDIDPVVVPRRTLEDLATFRDRLAAALEPFTVDLEETGA